MRTWRPNKQGLPRKGPFDDLRLKGAVVFMADLIRKLKYPLILTLWLFLAMDLPLLPLG